MRFGRAEGRISGGLDGGILIQDNHVPPRRRCRRGRAPHADRRGCRPVEVEARASTRSTRRSARRRRSSCSTTCPRVRSSRAFGASRACEDGNLREVSASSGCPSSQQRVPNTSQSVHSRTPLPRSTELRARTVSDPLPYGLSAALARPRHGAGAWGSPSPTSPRSDRPTTRLLASLNRREQWHHRGGLAQTAGRGRLGRRWYSPPDAGLMYPSSFAERRRERT